MSAADPPKLIVLPRVAGYGDDNVFDYGWGCVYRGVQTLRYYWKMPFMSLPQMRALCGTAAPPSSASVRSLWIEPPDIRRCRLLPRGKLVLFAPPRVDVDAFLLKSPRRTTRKDFDVVTSDFDRWWRFLKATLDSDRSPVLLDDQVHSFVLYGYDKNFLYVADPHFADPKSRLRKLPAQDLMRKTWMAFAL